MTANIECAAISVRRTEIRSSQNLYVTIDTQVPSVVQYTPFGAGHASADHLDLQFSEEIVAGV